MKLSYQNYRHHCYYYFCYMNGWMISLGSLKILNGLSRRDIWLVMRLTNCCRLNFRLKRDIIVKYFINIVHMMFIITENNFDLLMHYCNTL